MKGLRLKSTQRVSDGHGYDLTQSTVAVSRSELQREERPWGLCPLWGIMNNATRNIDVHQRIRVRYNLEGSCPKERILVARSALKVLYVSFPSILQLKAVPLRTVSLGLLIDS